MHGTAVKSFLEEVERRAAMTFIRSVVTAFMTLLMKNTLLRFSLIIIAVLLFSSIAPILIISFHFDRYTSVQLSLPYQSC